MKWADDSFDVNINKSWIMEFITKNDEAQAQVHKSCYNLSNKLTTGC